MVSWSHVVEAWKSKAVTLPPISIYEDRNSVDLFKLPAIVKEAVPIPTPVSILKPPVTTPVNTVQIVESVKFVEPVKPVEVKPAEPKRIIQKDPITIGMNLRDPLYSMASHAVKQRMECEEAQRLESIMRSVYQSQGGRSRGWTLSGLESYLKPRGASGGHLQQLQHAKSPFVWEQVLDDKNTSAFLDFICVAQRIRIAVWSDIDKSVTVFPAADSSIVEEGAVAAIPLYHIYSNGSVKSEPADSKTLIPLCATMGYAYLPPPSVMKSLAHLSIGELDSLAEKLGVTDLTGSKAQRVVTIAVWKLKQRLLA
jgi:hypothetical protein